MNTETPLERAASQAFGRFCVGSGALSVAVWAVIIAWVGSQVPAYDVMRHAIGELGAGPRSTALVMRALGYGLSGGLLALFASYLAYRLRRDPTAIFASLLLLVAAVCRMGAGVYACDPGCPGFGFSLDQDYHLYASRGSNVFLLLAIASWGVAVNRYPALKRFSPYCFGALSWSLVSFVMMATMLFKQGFYERIAQGLLGAWVLLFVWFLWRARVWAVAPERKKPDYAPRVRRFRR